MRADTGMDARGREAGTGTEGQVAGCRGLALCPPPLFFLPQQWVDEFRTTFP